jgi:hypothetical protein
MEFEDRVDDSFRKGKREMVSTVGDLLDELKELPADMELFDPVQVGVTCMNGHCLRVDISEYDEYD